MTTISRRAFMEMGIALGATSVWGNAFATPSKRFLDANDAIFIPRAWPRVILRAIACFCGRVGRQWVIPLRGN